MSPISIPFARLPHGADLPAPSAASAGASGLDLCAAISATRPVAIAPGAWEAIPTGLMFEIPPGFEGQVRPRSGLALRQGITVLNAPGTIDCDYRGEVQVILINLGREPFLVTRAMRVAQIIFAPVAQVELIEVETLKTTARGQAGFGSTGLGKRHASG
jgi:dUTP pyrophosphatase